MKDLDQYSEYIVSLRKQGMSFQEISRKLRKEKNIDLDYSTIAKYYKKIGIIVSPEHKIIPAKPDTNSITPIKHPGTDMHSPSSLPMRAAEKTTHGTPLSLKSREIEAMKDVGKIEYMHTVNIKPFPWDTMLVILFLVGFILLALWAYGDMYRVLFFFSRLFKAIESGNESVLTRIFSPC